MQPTLASVPGALLFRTLLSIVLILILIAVFFSYVDETQREFERSAIAQTRRIVDSALAVAFATYAVKHRLSELGELDGGNPFLLLDEYQIQPTAYRGEIERDIGPDLAAGWYYLQHRRLVAYKSYHLDSDRYFGIVLDYEDQNGNGRYDSTEDRFNSLQFVPLLELPR